MTYFIDAFHIARPHIMTVAAQARFEQLVARLTERIMPAVQEAMAEMIWPDWFKLQLDRYGPVLVREEADSLARQALTYLQQLRWLLPDVDRDTRTRQAVSHIAGKRGFSAHIALVRDLEQGLASSPPVTE